MTTIAVTFDGVSLSNPTPRSFKKTKDSFSCSFTFATNSEAEIAAIVAKAGTTTATTRLSGKTAVQTLGTSGTLVIGGDTYTKVAIMGEVKPEEAEGSGGIWWRYTVSFVQDTTT